MKITNLRLKNFRCFEDVAISFEENLTVIVAENGQGKSTLLDAIRIGVWPFIKSFDLAKSSTFNDPSNSIAVDDVRIIKLRENGMARQFPAEVELSAQWDGDIKTWLRYREKEDRKSKTLDNKETKKLSALSKAIQNKIRSLSGGPEDLPIFGYYGTGRLWAQKKLRDENELSENEEKDLSIRTFAYRNCMDPASSYKHFRAWFINAWESRTNMLTRAHVTESEKRLAEDRIKVVQGVIDIFLKPTTGWHTLEYSVEDQKTLILTHDQNGRMNVDYLSDGIRSMLAMVGDIAWRCVKLNQHFGAQAAIQTDGIVLIDEVDMHLHPRWQQIVLAQLREAFPNIQFIVTTHSPQVLSTVSREHIRVIEQDDTGFHVSTPEFSPLAHESGDALAKIMGTHKEPPLLIQETIRQYEQYIRNGQEMSDVAKVLRREMDEAGYQIHESDLITWRFLAARKGHGEQE